MLIQSMTVSETMDTDAVVSEIRGLAAAGCPLVRLTAPSLNEALHLREIRRRLQAENIRLPLVADIHFTPNAALAAAETADKVRINPGNYADRKRFDVREYTDAEYAAEVERVAERFRPLVAKLKERGRALRIGVNHGSLSDRILNRFGDTPQGMVESALEFVRICRDADYHDIVLSMKSSVPGVMVAAYRLLARRLEEQGLDCPIHLGVTEAGDGLEARIKSAAGIGSLLADGIGDTIRVSLAESSVHEIAAARAILEAVEREAGQSLDPRVPVQERDPAGPGSESWWRTHAESAPAPRSSRPWRAAGLVLGGGFPVRVEARAFVSAAGKRAQATARSRDATAPGTAIDATTAGTALGATLAALGPDERAELLSIRIARAEDAGSAEVAEAIERLRTELPPRSELPVLLEWSYLAQGEIHRIEALLAHVDGLSLAIGGVDDLADSDRFRLLARLMARVAKPVRWRIPADAARPGGVAARLSELCRDEGLESVGFLCAPGARWIARTRDLAATLAETGDAHFLEVPARGPTAALLAGATLLDGLGDALCLATDVEAPAWPPGGVEWSEEPIRSTYAILQACRLRLTRAEFIACPSCGRTQFDLQAVTRTIRQRTEHLKGVKIAIMGCIVNGPGEMADADFGYVGSGAGKVDLYVGRDRVVPGVPAAHAPDRLVELIRERGRWVDR